VAAAVRYAIYKQYWRQQSAVAAMWQRSAGGSEAMVIIALYNQLAAESSIEMTAIIMA